LKIKGKIFMRNNFTKAAIIAAAICTSFLFGVNAHVSGCDKKEGIEKSRCERHVKMAEKCGPLKGDAHFACDREFLIANPLDCTKLADKAADSCVAETKAFKTCEANQGREFMKCVATSTKESPMGH
jgi:hypothetical protein